MVNIKKGGIVKTVFNGKYLRNLRQKNKWSFETLANHFLRYGEGVSYGTIRNWELGKSIPNANDLQTIAAIFHVPAEALFKQVK